MDAWMELVERLNRHRFRTALTMLSVGWGILMLVLLLAAGTGLENNVRWQFRDDAINSVWVYGGRTSVPHQGLAVGRRVRLTNADHAAIAALPGVEHITSRFYLWGSFTVSYGDKNGAFEVRSVHPDHQIVEGTRITKGRYLNDLDIAEKRKVAVMGEEVADFLFGQADPIGEYVRVNNIAYEVVGVFQDEGGPGEVRMIVVPISTAQLAYGAGDRVHQVIFTVGEASLAQSTALADEVTALLAERHRFHPDDERALRVRNNLESFEEYAGVLRAIRGFVWIVGIGTILAGVVGVSNIMLVSVKERTSELGLRKALGATPAALVTMILQESVVLTAIAGYAGLVLGVVIVESTSRMLPDNEYFRNPEVDLGAVLLATVLVVVFGTLAGLFPALQAARVDPIVALRDE